MIVGMHRSTRLKIVDLNPYLSCILCGGYFIDATTITECVHSFCRACIVRFLETSKYCPVCEVQVHKSRPLHYIRSDKTLQDIVYKLVPGLFHNEMKRRRELYASQPPEAIKESRDAEDRGECLDEKFIYAPEEIFSLSVEYGSETENQDSSDKDDSIPKRRFLRCPAAVTVAHLKKFIRMKYGIPYTYEVDLQYDKESLRDDYNLMDVAYIFLWQRKGPMRFFYKIIERVPKKFKTDVGLQDKNIKAEEAVNSLDTKSEETKENILTTSTDHTVTSSSLQLEEEKCSASEVKIKCDLESAVVKKEPTAAQESSQKPKDEAVEATEISKALSKTELCSQKEVKPATNLKFFPSSASKVSSSDSKPAVMTVAPLTKPSSSLATSTSTTSSTGTVTHGFYTGISIKKSPPNTVPPFRISLPQGFSKLESCLLQMSPKETSSSSSSSSKKSSSSLSKKSKSSRSSLDKLELKVAQLKSASIKSIAPLVISVAHESKSDTKKPEQTDKRAADSLPAEKPVKEERVSAAEPVVADPKVNNQDDDKMDLDNDLFEGRLVIAEPDPPSRDDSESSTDHLEGPSPKNLSKVEDPEDEEIDVVDYGEVDSGRGSDISSRAEARSLSGDDDLGSPESVPKTPDSVGNHPISIPKPPVPSISEPKDKIPKVNGVGNNSTPAAISNGDSCVLDLSTCGRKRDHEGETLSHRSKPVANPAVLDKTRQTPCRSPDHPSFKVLSSVLPNPNAYKMKSENTGRNFKCRGNTLTVINPDPNGNRPKIVIRNLGPRPDRHDRFHHNHHHHHHHQRM